MPTSGILIDRESIKTMKKDIAFSQGKGDALVVDKNINQEEERKKAIVLEEEKRLMEIKKREEEMKKQQETNKKEAEIKAEELRKINEERKKEETSRLMALQEERKRAEEEERQRQESENEMKRKKQELEVKKMEEKRLEEEREKQRIEVEKRKIEETRRVQEEVKKQEEEKRKREEEKRRRKEAEKTERERLLEQKALILKEKEEIEENLSVFSRKENILAGENAETQRVFELIQSKFSRIEEQEKEAEKQQAEIEEKESLAQNSGEKKNLGKKRWQIEKKRQELEKKRWPLDSELEKINLKLADIEKRKKELEDKKILFVVKEKDISSRERINSLKVNKVDLGEELKRMDEEKPLFEEKSNSLLGEYQAIKEKLDKIALREGEVNNEKKLIETQEKSAKTLSERRDFEKKRWQIEEKRRLVESEKWTIEEEKRKAADSLKKYKERLGSFSEKREALVGKVEDISREIEGPPASLRQPDILTAVLAAGEALRAGNPELKSQPPVIRPEIKVEPKPEPKIEPKLEPRPIDNESAARIEAARKRIEALRRPVSPPSSPPPPPPSSLPLKPPKSPEPVFSTIQEEPIEPKIGIKQETISRFNSPLSVYENNRKPDAVLKKQEEEEMIRIVPQKPNWKEKILARAIIVISILIILMGILTFWYWYFRIRTQPPAANPINTQQKEQPKVEATAPLFKVDDTVILLFADDSEGLTKLSDVLDNQGGKGQFKQLVLGKNEKVLEIEDVFNLLSVDISLDFYNKIKGGFTLFSYSGTGGNFLGFAVKTADAAALSKIMKDNEAILKKIFEKFLSLSGEDSGAYYRVSDYYFAFAASSEGLDDLLMRLETALQKKALVKDLRLKDKGTQVELLQGWLAKDTNIYPEALINGSFGEVTKNAVLRFQTQYALPKTGAADSATRKKLNEFYSDF